jgi:ATP-dependent Lhr-like helicase
METFSMLLGEKIVNHYSFYTVFQTPEEYRLVTDSGQSLGTLWSCPQN